MGLWDMAGDLFGFETGEDRDRRAAQEAAEAPARQQLERMNQLQTQMQPGVTGGINAQQQLAGMYANQATGAGPSVSAGMLNEATARNVADQGAILASARGSSANPMIAARLAAQQGGEAGQQAARAAATMKAQEQLAAQAAMGQLANQQIGQQLSASGLGAQQSGGLMNAGLQAQQAKEASENALTGQMLGAGASYLGASSGAAKKTAAYGGEITQAPNQQENWLSSHFTAPKMSNGGHVPGKAQVFGDSHVNDTVDAKLSPGEIVIPRSIAKGKNPVGDSAKFVAAVLAQQGFKR